MGGMGGVDVWMDGCMGRGVGGDGRQAFLGGVGLYRYASDFNASFRRYQ